MRYPPNFLDEIRARISVSAVVGRKVALKRAGREYKGLSPFKMEKTPPSPSTTRRAFITASPRASTATSSRS
ncbi:MAG: CHC2 zinc finger domain-containing protein [Hyphomicrobium sp.]